MQIKKAPINKTLKSTSTLTRKYGKTATNSVVESLINANNVILE